jgi:hypothetical protein
MRSSGGRTWRLVSLLIILFVAALFFLRPPPVVENRLRGGSPSPNWQPPRSDLADERATAGAGSLEGIATEGGTLPPSRGLFEKSAEGLVAAAAATLLFVAGLVAARAALGEAAVVASMVAAFEVGGLAPRLPGSTPTCAPWLPPRTWDDMFLSADARARVPRPALLAQLAALLRPSATDQYALVVGESGTGKSTAVRAAVRGLPAPKGVVYFSAPERVALFSNELAAAVGFFTPFNPLASFYSWWGGQSSRSQGAETHALWASLRAILPLAAAAFRAAHGRPAVLVIDAADYAAKKDPAFFRDLQDFAKVCADSGALQIVFVSSEGVALPLMRAASARSRMRVLEVPDIADADAEDYLVGRGVAHAAAAAVVRDVAGGRFALLAQAAAAAAAGTMDAFRDELGEETAATFAELQLLPTHALFTALLSAGRVRRSVALQMLGTDLLDTLLTRNVVALHADGAYTVHARHIECWLRRGQVGRGGSGTGSA